MIVNEFAKMCMDQCHVTLQPAVSMEKYTTLRVGGPADYVAEPESEAQLCALLRLARERSVPTMVMGNGSNLLVRDGGIRGLVIRLGRTFSAIETIPGGLYAQGGALLSVLARQALEKRLTGLEFAQGIPGTVGGGVYMNAGAYGGDLGQRIISVRIWDGQRVRDVAGADMAFSYRHSRAMDEAWVILGAAFRLEEGDPAAIEDAMRDFASRRKEKQPLEYPSAGSFFKRPAGHFAGALIEGAGLKGFTVGGAQVSCKHAGFLINVGGASARDFLQLMGLVQRIVEIKYQVRLEPEVRIIGSDP